MKFWLISQSENNGYDTYDSAVVAAETEEAARAMHPGDQLGNWNEAYDGTWASKPENVKVRLIGEAAPDIEAGVWCASFNAG